eukprot:4641960-Pleurochrysis_carterae.AAC.1
MNPAWTGHSVRWSACNQVSCYANPARLRANRRSRHRVVACRAAAIDNETDVSATRAPSANVPVAKTCSSSCFQDTRVGCNAQVDADPGRGLPGRQSRVFRGHGGRRRKGRLLPLRLGVSDAVSRTRSGRQRVG